VSLSSTIHISFSNTQTQTHTSLFLPSKCPILHLFFFPQIRQFSFSNNELRLCLSSLFIQTNKLRLCDSIRTAEKQQQRDGDTEEWWNILPKILVEETKNDNCFFPAICISILCGFILFDLFIFSISVQMCVIFWFLISFSFVTFMVGCWLLRN
jgi:hypothetical protein